MATRVRARSTRPAPPLLALPRAVLTTVLAAVLAAVLTVTTAGCGSGSDAPNGVDRAFVQQMIPHHERAIAVARIGVNEASDPRVRAFAARIVREQTPELTALRKAADGQRLDLAAGARTAHHRITDAEVTRLRALRGAAFDRRFVTLHIASETGAAQMAEQEIHGGNDDAALELAKSIATAPTTQIPELRRLLAALGS